MMGTPMFLVAAAFSMLPSVAAISSAAPLSRRWLVLASQGLAALFAALSLAVLLLSPASPHAFDAPSNLALALKLGLGCLVGAAAILDSRDMEHSHLSLWLAAQLAFVLTLPLLTKSVGLERPVGAALIGIGAGFAAGGLARSGVSLVARRLGRGSEPAARMDEGTTSAN